MNLKRESKRLARRNRTYSQMRKEYLSERRVCRAKIDNCNNVATDIHHKKGRGLFLLDTETWLPVCRNCHEWIENNPSEAYELGFSLKRT